MQRTRTLPLFVFPMFVLLAVTPLAVPVGAEEDLLNHLTAEERAQGFLLLFNGRDLDGWEGDPRIWSVENGDLIGSSDAFSPPHNTYLIADREFGDFVLQLEVKLRNGNSGIQFRSTAFPDWIVHGYQADLSFAGDFSAWGNFYEEKGRGRGVMPTPTTGWEQAKDVVRDDGWNHYEIRARGPYIRLTLNGKVTIDTQDEKASTGVIALQLHEGKPMQVRFRNIKIKPL